MQVKTTNPSRRSTLIEVNVRWLRQALPLLDRLDDRAYSTTSRSFAPHRAGARLRHVLEFYRCFLDGLEWSHVDYDFRRREMALENSPEAASAAIRSIIQSLESSNELRGPLSD